MAHRSHESWMAEANPLSVTLLPSSQVRFLVHQHYEGPWCWSQLRDDQESKSRKDRRELFCLRGFWEGHPERTRSNLDCISWLQKTRRAFQSGWCNLIFYPISDDHKIALRLNWSTANSFVHLNTECKCQEAEQREEERERRQGCWGWGWVMWERPWTARFKE